MCLSSSHLGGGRKGHGENRDKEGRERGEGRGKEGSKTRNRERICHGLPVSLKVMGKLLGVGVEAGMKENKAWN